MIWFAAGVAAYGVFWAICGVAAYGLTLAHFQRSYPVVAYNDFYDDRKHALLVGLLGPFGLLSYWRNGSRQGLLFRWRRPDADDYGLDRARNPSYSAPFFAVLADQEGITREHCPLCGVTNQVLPSEREARRVYCGDCGKHYDPVTRRPWAPPEPEGGEPDWAEPTDAERAWAQATMPGQADGHTIGWRLWAVAEDESGSGVEDLTTAQLLTMSVDAVRDQLQAVEQAVEALRGRQRFRLTSLTSEAEWPAGRPQIAVREPGLPSAHGVGIYAAKSASSFDFEMHRMLSFFGRQNIVIGTVALWGDVVEHKNGYRARYAYPTRIWTGNRPSAEAMADDIARHYGIEVTAGALVDMPSPYSVLEAGALAMNKPQPGQIRTVSIPRANLGVGNIGGGLLGSGGQS